ncbi:Decaprenyl-phosphate phosphoribosyltransferase [Limihaloglobus sulfuriphilus]|uniref:Decaprenyl-phosphate phosphoribosyltransferase n=1 Tax=Limihaloglobus sulfuriphilus TaxID=1851148 RepID=A0A1R7T632_9BACT|nr:decaprenyl-phosphate phosphoribosyltransferase [Limihaloglobus sulfuriphilus]AQQ72226.1 Decaprenyl-phosphate phosphoribosyltransferase [Limihaloglobus sulfuriphilus]
MKKNGYELLKLTRPRHWIKNFVVLLPLFFSFSFTSPAAWAQALSCAIVFCLASSIVYIVNDIEDRDRDCHHPVKKNRPIASGAVSIKEALALLVVLAVITVLLSLSLDLATFVIILMYLLLQAAYTFFLKKHALLDVTCISLGFVLRAVAGAIAIDVYISHWLFICMFTLFLFMGFCKRYNEIAVIGSNDQALLHRQALNSYDPAVLTHLITLAASVFLISFLLYSTSPETIERFGGDYMVYTFPLVIIAVGRFAMLSIRGTYNDPVELIYKDILFAGTCAAWSVSILIILLLKQGVF